MRQADGQAVGFGINLFLGTFVKKAVPPSGSLNYIIPEKMPRDSTRGHNLLLLCLDSTEQPMQQGTPSNVPTENCT